MYDKVIRSIRAFYCGFLYGPWTKYGMGYQAKASLFNNLEGNREGNIFPGVIVFIDGYRGMGIYFTAWQINIFSCMVIPIDITGEEFTFS